MPLRKTVMLQKRTTIVQCQDQRHFWSTKEKRMVNMLKELSWYLGKGILIQINLVAFEWEQVYPSWLNRRPSTAWLSPYNNTKPVGRGLFKKKLPLQFLDLDQFSLEFQRQKYTIITLSDHLFILKLRTHYNKPICVYFKWFKIACDIR